MQKNYDKLINDFELLNGVMMPKDFEKNLDKAKELALDLQKQIAGNKQFKKFIDERWKQTTRLYTEEYQEAYKKAFSPLEPYGWSYSEFLANAKIETKDEFVEFYRGVRSLKKNATAMPAGWKCKPTK